MERKKSIEEDNMLLAQLKDGDMRAFNLLFDKYYKPLCAYAHRFVVREDLEEIVQDLFLWLWKNHEHLEIRTSLSSYLFRSTHARCLNKIEQNEVRQRLETLYWKNYKDIPSIDNYQLEELLNRIHEAINNLPESYREAFIMHRFKDKSYKEIAQELNTSTQTVNYRIQKALNILRNDLKDYLPIITFLF